jgi:hypothetical protein
LPLDIAHFASCLHNDVWRIQFNQGGVAQIWTTVNQIRPSEEVESEIGETGINQEFEQI